MMSYNLACILVTHLLLRFLFSIRHVFLYAGISRAMMRMTTKLVNTIPSMPPTAMVLGSRSTGLKPVIYDTCMANGVLYYS